MTNELTVCYFSGYENEDGSFKEETIGKDCVVRGKYGYVDPEGNKREYEYQTGNPCDPNRKEKEQQDADDEEEYYAEGPSRQQELAGIINARPRPAPRRPVAQQPQQLQPHPQQFQQQHRQQYAFPQQRQL